MSLNASWRPTGVSDHDLLFSEKGAEPAGQQVGSGAQFPELPPPGQRSASTPSAIHRKPSAKAASKPGAVLRNTRFCCLLKEHACMQRLALMREHSHLSQNLLCRL